MLPMVANSRNVLLALLSPSLRYSTSSSKRVLFLLLCVLTTTTMSFGFMMCRPCSPFCHHRHPGRMILTNINGRVPKRWSTTESTTIRMSSSSLPENNAVPNNSASSIREAKYNELISASKMSLAPMMEYTDRHFRHLVRLVSNRTLLYTEMVAANALSHERRARQEDYRNEHPTATQNEVRAGYSDQYLRRFLAQGQVQPLEGPSVLQLGGSDPQQMWEAAQTVMDLRDREGVACDYTALNLNCGCPSPKVAGKGCFGAALMDDPKLVAELTEALHDGTNGHLPITVKCRIGTDSNQAFTKQAYTEMDPEKEYANLCRFVETVASKGIVTDFQVHARIAVLQKSFSPADNRKIPPLKYDYVRRLVQDYPELTFSLNGGIETLSQAQEQFQVEPNLCGVMIGRSWAAQPWSFAMTDRLLYHDADGNDSSIASSPPKNRLEILKAYGKHADREEAHGDPVKIRRFIVKAVVPLFAGEPNGKRYRIALDQIAGLPKKLHQQGKTLEGQPPLSELILNAAMQHLPEDVLLRSPEESYERILEEEAKRRRGSGGEGGGGSDRSRVVMEWQTQRKEDEEKEANAKIEVLEGAASSASADTNATIATI